MKNSFFPFVLFAAALLAAYSPLCAQQAPAVLLNAEPSARQSAVWGSLFEQSLSCGVICLGFAAIVLWTLLICVCLSGSAQSRAKTNATKAVPKKLAFGLLFLLLFVGLSLTQCKVMSGNMGEEGCPALTKPVGDESFVLRAKYSPHDCECICVGHSMGAPHYISFCKYCGRHMEPSF